MIAIAVLVAGWVYREQLVAAWGRLLAELNELWERLFGLKKADVPVIAAPPLALPRPFSAYADPFASGLAARASLAELLRYTFEALEAWGRERRTPRLVGQTPHEYVQQVGAAAPFLASDLSQLAEVYGQVAYAKGQPPSGALDLLRRLWRQMTAAGSPRRT